MITHTHATGGSVKQKEKTLVDWARHRRAMRAFYESPSIPKECLLVFPYLLSRQGHKEFAYPSHRKMAKRYGVSPNTITYWIDITVAVMGPVFSVQCGAAFQGSKGKGRNRYYCTPYHLWPLEFIQNVENGKLPKTPPRRSKDYKPNPYPTIPAPLLPKRVVAPRVTIKNVKVSQPEIHSMESMERVVNTSREHKRVEVPTDPKFACEQCGKNAPHGFHSETQNVWVCDSDCECAYYEASIDVPDF